MLRLLCNLGLHRRPVRVVDEYEVIGFSEIYGLHGRIARSHYECPRCHRSRRTR